ncbi:endonuclease/exonuclease/phosphatase family protein [Rhizobium sp. TRM95796]|uniref:endonuclease/exonuclease/phosphatase family protein n=1 Tax=Rhizobium sp. TRM95796 TaxID=2979862 RepID=UPI0021E84CCC|nr:endonuclease/exonuclease/phosphatase family protein [Rhizobium sp. TRM95796]MCV3766407.1 endonuclease/exonuclease/phosphatase family protein [Rhizobium sp. TRM95796]
MNITLSAAVVAALSAWPLSASAMELTVMSFNIWGGGVNAGKPIDETVAAIKAVDPDIVGIQETKPEPDPCTAENCVPTGKSVAADIAKALGYYYYDQSANNPAIWANAILSRYPIGKATKNDLGVEIVIEGKRIMAYNIHLTDYPYQPYQLLNIEYGAAPFLKTAEEAIAAATATRGPALDLLEQDMKAADGADAAFVFGDFNEPSHHDWTEAAVKAGLQPMVVAYPSAKRIESWGFTDLFRAAWPDVAAKPAFTWTPTSEPTAKDDHHDRIDYTLGRAKGLKVLEAGVVGEKKPEADIVVTPWPADHRATMARVSF